LLSFAYVYFLESGFFKGLRPIQTKKFPPAISGCARLSEPIVRNICFSSFRACPKSRADPAAERSMTQIVVFGKKKH
jgi:hypothetical protein